MPAQQPSPIASPYPLALQQVTVIDHAFVLADQLVEMSPSTVERVISSRLIELARPRPRPIRYFSGPDPWDTLLVILPAPARLARGELVVITGRVRTIAGVEAAGGLKDVREKALEHIRDKPVVVAESVRTADGVDLLPRR